MAELEAEAASLGRQRGSVAARSLRQARQLESCQIVEKFCFLSCFMLLSGLVHIHTDRRAEWESDRDRKREGEREGQGLPTADTFVSTHVVGADINNSINCCTPKFCQRASFGA